MWPEKGLCYSRGIRRCHIGRTCTLLLLASVASWPSLVIIARIHLREPHLQHVQQLKADVIQQDTDAPKALRFERIQPRQSQNNYHAKLRVHLSAVTPVKVAAALKSYAPPWVVWTDSAIADIELQHVRDCSSLGRLDGDSEASQELLGQHPLAYRVILQQGLDTCYDGEAGKTLRREALDKWQSALLVVSPSNLELQVQAMQPSLQDKLRFWSMPWGTDLRALERLQHSNSSSELKGLLNHGRLVLAFGVSGNDTAVMTSLLMAAAQTNHILLVLGPSSAVDKVCGVAQPQEPSSQQQRLCKSLRHVMEVPTEADYVHLLQAARYVAALHTSRSWQIDVGGAVMLGKRLVLFNHTAPHEHYRCALPGICCGG